MATSFAYALSENNYLARKLLNDSVTMWFITATIGQWFFAYYIMVFYGGHALDANWAAWSKRMIHGIVEGDIIGNIAGFLHILLAFLITFCGPLQLMPQVRNRFPTFHRYNGRAYVMTALVISVAAIYSIWSREAIIGGLFGQIATTLNGVIIITCAIMAWRFAVARQIQRHQRWAMRLFLAVSGVWFFRVIRGFWVFVNDGTSPGSNATLTGPFDMFVNYAGLFVPLLLLEVYFWVRDKGSDSAKYVFAALSGVLTVMLVIGIYGAAQLFWIPNI